MSVDRIQNFDPTPTKPYLYCWVDFGTWVEETGEYKKYLGIHNGSKGYSYIGSGWDFKKAYAERPNDFYRMIVMVNESYEWIQDQETKVLKRLNAAKNAAWYNRINNVPNTAGRPPANKGKKLSAETREKIAAANRGKTHSEETRAKISAANKIVSDEYRKQLSERSTGRIYSEEAKLAMSQAAKRRWANNRNKRNTIEKEQEQCLA